MKTLYGILGIDSGATQEQVERAFTNFSAKLQEEPCGDLSPEETRNQMVAVREAYRTLSNPILRQRYDRKLAELDFETLTACRSRLPALAHRVL